MRQPFSSMAEEMLELGMLNYLDMQEWCSVDWLKADGCFSCVCVCAFVQKELFRMKPKRHNFTAWRKVMKRCSYASPGRSVPKPSQAKQRACSGSLLCSESSCCCYCHAAGTPALGVFMCDACAYLEALHKSHLKSDFFVLCVFCLVLFRNLAINNPTKRKTKLGIGSVTSSGVRGVLEINIFISVQ